MALEFGASEKPTRKMRGDVTNKDMAKWYRGKAREEIKKEKPDYKAFHFYVREARRCQRTRPVIVPKSMLRKESKEEIEKDYAGV